MYDTENVCSKYFIEEIKGIELTQEKKKILNGLWRYIKNKPNNGVYPQNKGLLFRGGAGRGKTFAMNIFMNVCKRINYHFELKDSREVIRDILNGTSIDRYIHSCLCIDELGREPNEVKIYGTTSDPMREIIDAKYEIWRKKRFLTFYITNLNDCELKSRYGESTFSRICEMSNLINFKEDNNLRYGNNRTNQ